MLGIFLDTEANGLNAKKHRILEIAFQILDVATGEVKERFHALIAQSPEDWKRSDPESLKVTGFTWEEVSKGHNRDWVAGEIKKLFARLRIRRGEAVFICQNPSFDRAFFSQLIEPETQELLLWPYHWLDLASMFWSESVHRGKEDPKFFPWNTGISKDRIAATYQLKTEEKPHRAMNGVNHLILCYEAVVGFPNKTLQAP